MHKVFKKTLIFLFLPIAVFAGSFEDNLKNLIQDKMKISVSIVDSAPVKGIKGLRIVTFEDTAKKQRFPMLTDIQGKTVISFQGFVSENKETESSLSDAFAKIQQYNEKGKNEQLDKLFASIPEKNMITLNNGKKRTLYVVSDPECPYCRKELGEIEKRLEEANLKIIIAPVHGKSSYIKGEMIYQVAQKAKSNKEIIAAMKKYFDKGYKLSAKEEKVEPKIIQENTQIIFSTGLIRGVPFVHESK